MTNKTLFAALSLALASTAFTASANSQLAASLGVEPGLYTTAELIQLKDARENDDLAQARFIENRVAAVTRGAAFVGASSEAVVFAYENSLDGEDGGAEDLAHFVAKVNGDVAVSDEAVAFSLAQAVTNIEDER